jgi:hypothetical protein
MGQAMLSAGCAVEAILAGGDVLRHYTGLMHRRHQSGLRQARWLGRLLRLRVTYGLASMRAAERWGGRLASWVERVHVEGRHDAVLRS